MLSIGKLGRGRANADYYLATVARGAEDYYTGKGEVPGEWMGTGAARLGLSGRMDAEDLRAALAGVDPRSGQALGGRTRRDRVPGWDLTFSAPKSVSALYALGGPEVQQAVAAAHRKAVAAGIAYLERHATVSRRRVEDGEVELVRGEGLVVAAFRHRTSRAGDPQLHTHCLAVNAVERVDGGWGALHSPVIYRHARTAGFVYQVVLRSDLTDELGARWGEVRNGCAEIEGIDRRLLRRWSTRRAEVEAQMEARGEHSAAAAQVATLETRRAKDYGVDPETLDRRWAAEAAELGVRAADVRAALGHTGPRVTVADLDAVADELASPLGLTSEQASFDRADVIRAWCEALPAGARVDLDALEELADSFVEGEDVVPVLDTTARAAAGGPRRADGRATTARLVDRRWTTTDMLVTERRLLARARAGRGVGAGQVDAAVAESVLAHRPSLSDEQAAMVRAVTGSGHGVEVVVGQAGTGKTYALAAAAAVWRAGGYRPVGVALAARAAAEMENTAGIPSTTLARFLLDCDQAPGGLLDERDVVVVDEAGMVGTRRLAELLAHVQAAGAKAVLVGDHHQLPAVEAGGAFAGLVRRLAGVELTENQRQVEAWEREALAQLRTGSGGRVGVMAVVARYDGRGRLHIGDTPATVRAAMVADWYEARSQAEKVGMIALRRRDVAELNARARALLVAEGSVEAEGVHEAGRTFGLGDRVVCLHGDRRVGVHNALFGRVVAVQSEERALEMEAEDTGRRVVIPAAYLAAGHLDHAYATTIHKAQGASYDRTLLLGDDRLYRQAGYTGLGRGRIRNDLYLVANDDRDLEIDVEEHAPFDKDSPHERLVRALHRDGSKTMATDELGRSPSAAVLAPLAALWRERDALTTTFPPDPTPARAGLARALDQARADAAVLETAREVAEERRGGWSGRAGRQADREIRKLAGRYASTEHRVAALEGRHQELEAMQRDRSTWETSHRAVLDRVAILDRAIAGRAALAGRAAEIDRPSHLVALLGDPPVGLEGREHWREAAAAVESYRARWQLDDSAALDQLDGPAEQGAHFHEVQNAVEAATEVSIETVDAVELGP